MSQSAHSATAQSQLRRLATLTDVVYALALVLIDQWLPLPEESSAEGSVWLIDLLAEYAMNMVAVLIGLVFVILYWIRSNTLLTAPTRCTLPFRSFRSSSCCCCSTSFVSAMRLPDRAAALARARLWR